MQYSPKLKTAMDRIKAILKEDDIAAHVVLHTPGFSEYHTKLETSYSCIKVHGDELRMRARLQEDFDGDKEAWNKSVSDTTNMLMCIVDSTGPQIVALMDLLEKLEKHIEIIRDDKGGHSSHATQNN